MILTSWTPLSLVSVPNQNMVDPIISLLFHHIITQQWKFHLNTYRKILVKIQSLKSPRLFFALYLLHLHLYFYHLSKHDISLLSVLNDALEDSALFSNNFVESPFIAVIHVIPSFFASSLIASTLDWLLSMAKTRPFL
jgi:hypothetical protein